MLKPRSKRPRLWGLVLTVACLLVSAAAAYRLNPMPGETVCASRLRVVSGLERLFGEAQHASAVSSDDSVMEVFVSRENGTWTLLRSLPDGRACVVATGRGAWRVPELRAASLEI